MYETWERHHRMLMELTPAGIYACTAPSGVIEYFNRSAARLWGREPAIGDTDACFCGSLRLFRPDGTWLPHEQTPMARVLRGGPAVRDEEVVIERPDGSRTIAAVNIDPIIDSDGKLVGAVNVFQDISERKRHEEEQGQLAAIVESSHDAIVSKLLDGTILSWNRGAERLFGYTASEAVGQPITIIIPPERLGEEQSILESLRRGERIEHFETVRVAKDGRRIDVSVTISPIRDQSGRIIGASKVARDISESKRTEDRLRQQNENLRLLSEAAGLLLTTDDPDTAVGALYNTLGNRLGIDACWSLMTKNASEEPAVSCIGIAADAARAIAEVDLARSASAPPSASEPLVRTHVHTSEAPLPQVITSSGIRAYTCFPLLAGQRLLGTLSFASRTREEYAQDEIELLRTICHYVAAAYDRAELIDQLREEDRRKDDFLATLAHELRNPLAPIRSGLSVLRTSTNAAAAHRAHDIMERQVEYIVRLVDDLLEVSRISQGTIALRTEVTDLAAVVQHALDTIQPFIDQARHELTVSLPAEPVWLEADPVRVTQVVANLLHNAAKYTEDAGRISLRVWREGHEVVLSVQDNGEGISDELMPRIFNMFSQTADASRQGHSGLGIGLGLARTLVQMHDGTIEARSEGPQRGSEFIVRLPSVPAAGPRGPRQEAARENAGQASASPPVHEASRSVLVVDDNVDSAESVAMLLRHLGHSVRIATSGAAALEKSRADPPAAVLLDIGLPDVDGYTVARRLRADEGRRRMLIVAMTGYGQDEDRQRSCEAGFDEHLVKPVDLDTLQTLLSSS